ncbi:MAG: 2-(1,2-epoxy-1,2-dihydrophenyl)acetyl-CoA isomerase PaaG [Rhodocyclaceae bacterium]|nr:2-(1,2-epoxy-1,2-dihydrophenyl)acetyl-CoA isomerase [Rhodocyclaceae bacterium]MCW5596674.1 2-(1,2-epoxy-1,2-dihydrophenyl)acetyl-CoA isomerase PaaG [Rhodocyclaceae bacterium]
MSAILYQFSDGVARITLNRPDKLNSLNEAMHGELRQAIGRVQTDGARSLILTGAGRAFCTGQDLSERVTPPGAPPPDLGLSIETHYKPLVLALRALPLPVIAAVNGAAAGAGANLALACDIVLAAQSAFFIQAFSRLGLAPDCGGSYFLPRLAGTARALGLALTAGKLPAEQAAAWGMIWQCLDDDKLMPEAEALAVRFAQGPPLAYAAIKRALYASPHNTLEQQLDMERDTQGQLGRSEDYREGVAAFMEKRPAVFKGK